MSNIDTLATPTANAAVAPKKKKRSHLKLKIFILIILTLGAVTSLWALQPVEDEAERQTDMTKQAAKRQREEDKREYLKNYKD